MPLITVFVVALDAFVHTCRGYAQIAFKHLICFPLCSCAGWRHPGGATRVGRRGEARQGRSWG